MKSIFILVCILIPGLLLSEPQIKQFYPERSLLLGQPLYWLVEIRHPIWEAYDLKFGPCPDLKMSVAEKKVTEVAGEIRVFYKLSLVPTVLKTSCTPSLIISGEKGETTVLSGKPLTVQTITGDSEEIRMPVLPVVEAKTSFYYTSLFTALAVLGLVCLILAMKRVYANLPSQKYLRDVRRAEIEVRSGKLPIQVWRLLRSEMVWGFEAEAFTPAQLSEKGGGNVRLIGIATALQSLEAWRYSGSSAQWDGELVRQALTHASVLVELKSPLRRWRTT
jgi:hypothetical protein